MLRLLNLIERIWQGFVFRCVAAFEWMFGPIGIDEDGFEYDPKVWRIFVALVVLTSMVLIGVGFATQGKPQ